MARSDYANSTDIRKLVLFLSNDNHCCGRFCEELFNHFAGTSGLKWEGISRALRPTDASRWTYPMSPIAVDFLRRRRARAVNGLRPPLGLTHLDLQVSSLVVALDETAHRPIIDTAWQQYAEWVQYWHGGVLNERLPGDVFSMLEEYVSRLVQQLSGDRAYFDAA
jgi:protein-tyrosine phosphatase